MFQGDAKQIVDAVNSVAEDLSSCGHIISDIKLLLLSFQSWSFTHVKRFANQVAHHLANVLYVYRMM